MSDIDWKKLSAKFPDNQVSKKPKFRVVKGSNGRTDTTGYAHCDICGGWHPTKGVVHLDYVGHADITTRLNEVAGPDNWSLEPMAYKPDGTPLTSDGGMWCWLTIGETKKMCFGDAQGKSGPDAVKEMIGDAIRNGAMRFGVGTYLWSKSDAAEEMHSPEPTQPAPPRQQQQKQTAQQKALGDAMRDAKEKGISVADIKKWIASSFKNDLQHLTNDEIGVCINHITAEVNALVSDTDIPF